MVGRSLKVALITGVTGQDDAHLAEFLLSKGYIVHSVKRRSSSFNTDRIDHLVHDPHEQGVSFYLHYGDVTDATNLIRIIQETQPDDIYNLAAQSHVQVSFEAPEYTANADGLGTLRLLEAIRILGRERDTRLSGFHLRAVRKGAGDPAKGDHAVLSALSLRGGKALCPLDHGQLSRGPWHARLERHLSITRARSGVRTFVTARSHGRLRRSSTACSRSCCWATSTSNAIETTRATSPTMWLMLQQDQPDDYVLATGETLLREFVERAFAHVGRTIVWRASGLEEKGFEKSTDRVLAEVIRVISARPRSIPSSAT